MSILFELSKPLPPSMIQKAAPGKYGDYVNHADITQRLLSVVGLFDFELVEVIRGQAPEIVTKSKTYPARENAIVGVVARLTIRTEDGIRSVEEVGSEDNPAMGHDGENLKNAMSDALKRCAMRLSLGLQLWAQAGSGYWLHSQLEKDQAVQHDS